nr:hypothetical protein [Methanobacterium formicicum]
MVEINPLDEFGRPIKRRGIFIQQKNPVRKVFRGHAGITAHGIYGDPGFHGGKCRKGEGRNTGNLASLKY